MEDVKEIIEINMKICISTYPCKHYVIYKNNNGDIITKILFGTEIIKIMFRDKMILDDTIITHVLNLKNINDENIYKNFNSNEIDILKDMLTNRTMQGCENNPDLFLYNISKIINMDTKICYLSNPCCHYIEYIDNEANLKNEIFSTPQIIKIMIKFNYDIDDTIIKHFINQIIKNEKIMNKYFTSDEINKLNKLYVSQIVRSLQ